MVGKALFDGQSEGRSQRSVWYEIGWGGDKVSKIVTEKEQRERSRTRRQREATSDLTCRTCQQFWSWRGGSDVRIGGSLAVRALLLKWKKDRDSPGLAGRGWRRWSRTCGSQRRSSSGPLSEQTDEDPKMSQDFQGNRSGRDDRDSQARSRPGTLVVAA